MSVKLKTISRLFAPLWKNTPTLVKAVIFLFLASVINLAIPELIRRLISADYNQALLHHPWLSAFIMLSLFSLQGIFGYFRIYNFALLGQRVVSDQRRDLFASILNKPVIFFDSFRSGDLISRINADTQILQDLFSVKLSVALRYSVQVIGGIALMLFISIKLSLLIILTLPVLVGFSIFLSRKLKVYSKKIQHELGLATILAEESILGIKIIKTFGQINLIAEHFYRLVENIFDLSNRRSKISAFFQSFVSFLMYSMIFLFILFGLNLNLKGELAAADLTAFILYALIVAVSFGFLAGTIAEIAQALGAAERIFEVLDKHKSSENLSANQLTDKNISISFNNVDFSYSSREDVKVLKNLSFAIPAGKVSALIGPSGVGKSTILNLILGFYSPQSGEILINQQDLKTINPDSYLQKIAFVPQEPTVFDFSILENLKMGNPQASLDEIKSACAKANILDFIESLPNKFETNCGSRGVDLSGGQKQRLAIARSILKKPDLIILDEATSALDSNNEALIQSTIASEFKDKTVLIVTHRLSAIKDAENIVLLDFNGQISSGNHNELMQKSELYRYMQQHQAQR